MIEKIKHIVGRIAVNKKVILFCFSFLALGLIFAMPVYADPNWLVTKIADFFNLLSSGLGYILLFLLQTVVSVAQYNGFITAPAVTTGWIIVRDVCNMFFILILLVIAFATILRLDGYNWKKDVPRLLMYAVLINFSKTICGLMIDFSQVFMMTFVNAVSANGAGNLAVMFQVQNYKSLVNTDGSSTTSAITNTGLLAGTIAGLIAMIITTIMVVAILTTLVMRMIFIWIYVLLSPAAFLLNSFAGGKSYYGQWMKKFTTELIGGPVLAFFLWLALAVANNADPSQSFTTDRDSTGLVSGGVALFTSGPFQKYLIVIGLLYGGMQVASQVGGAAGKAAGTAMKRTDSLFDNTKKFAVNRVQDATGISAVKSYGKSFMAAYSDNRKGRIEKQAASIAGKLGVAQGFVGKGYDAVRDKTWGRFGKQAKDLRKDAAKDIHLANDLESGGAAYEQRVTSRLETAKAPGANLRISGTDYTWDGHAHAWGDPAGKFISSTEVKDKLRKDDLFNVDVNADIVASRNLAQTRIQDADKLDKKQKWTDRAIKWGGLGLGSIASPAALGFMGSVGTDEVIEWTGINKKIASGYTAKKIDDARSGYKDDDNSTVLNDLNDKTKGVQQRFGAFLEAMNRKLLTEQDVARLKTDMAGALGGLKNGSFADKKINSRYNAAIDKNYKGLTGDFSKAKDIKHPGDPGYDDHLNAIEEIKLGFTDGSYKMKDLGADTLKSVIHHIASSLSDEEFVKQTKELKPGVQANAVIELEVKGRAGDQDALLKLAEVTDAKRAFNPGGLAPAAAYTPIIDTWLRSLKPEKLNKILSTGGKAQQDALREMLETSVRKATHGVSGLDGTVGYGALPEATLKKLNSAKIANRREIRKDLGITAAPVTDDLNP